MARICASLASFRFSGPSSSRLRTWPRQPARSAMVCVPPPSMPRENGPDFLGSPPMAAGMLADSAGERQVHAECRALSSRTLDGDGAAVIANQFTDNGQTEPGPLL